MSGNNNIAPAVKVEPDSKGNVTITIKVVIAAPNAAAAGVKNPKEIVLSSDSESDDSVEEIIKVPVKVEKISTTRSGRSIRSRIQVDDDEIDDEGDYEVEWGLSQQLNAFDLQKQKNGN